MERIGGMDRMAVAVVEDVRGRVLLTRTGRGHWALPGGRCDGGCAPDVELAGAIRRTVGLGVRVVDLVGLYCTTSDDPDKTSMLTYAFRCEALADGPVPPRPAPAVAAGEPGTAVTLSWHPTRRIPTPVASTACAVLTDVAARRSGVVRHLRVTDPHGPAVGGTGRGPGADAVASGAPATPGGPGWGP